MWWEATGWPGAGARRDLRPQLIGGGAEARDETLARRELGRGGFGGAGSDLAAWREEGGEATGGEGEEGDGKRGDEEADDGVLECGETRVEDCVEAAEDDEQRGGKEEGQLLPGRGGERKGGGSGG